MPPGTITLHPTPSAELQQVYETCLRRVSHSQEDIKEVYPSSRAGKTAYWTGARHLTASLPSPFDSPFPHCDASFSGMSSHSAARRVYDAMELRQSIYRFVDQADRPTLARMMVLEQAGLEAVAEVLYEKVDLSMLDDLASAGRSQVYGAAVRTLDISPPPPLHIDWLSDGPLPASHIDLVTLSSDITAWRKRFPRLRTILYQYPTNLADDAYVVHLNGDHISVELESHVMVPYWIHPWKSPNLPPTPVCPSIKVRHTFTLTMFNGDFDPEVWRVLPASTANDMRNKWTNYLFFNPELDERITGIDIGRCMAEYFDTSPPKNLAFLSQRKADLCLPMTEATIVTSMLRRFGMDLPHYIQILSCLDEKLRSLSIPESFFHFAGASRAIAMLDSAFPDLHYLSITVDGAQPKKIFKGVTLSGLPELRKLTIHGASGDVSSDRGFARCIAGLGSRHCVYLNRGVGIKNPTEEAFHRLVKSCRGAIPTTTGRGQEAVGSGISQD